MQKDTNKKTFQANVKFVFLYRDFNKSAGKKIYDFLLISNNTKAESVDVKTNSGPVNLNKKVSYVLI